MTSDFYNNLRTLTSNLEDISFTKFATVTNTNKQNNTCTVKEEESETTHENVNTYNNNLQVGDKVILGFVDNSIYNPIIICGGEESYTKNEIDALLQKKVNEPTTEGRNGQVLTTDGQGGRSWTTVQGGGGSTLMVGSFEIDDNGDLIVTLPSGTANPYYINNDGDLIYDTEAT